MFIITHTIIRSICAYVLFYVLVACSYYITRTHKMHLAVRHTVLLDAPFLSVDMLAHDIARVQYTIDMKHPILAITSCTHIIWVSFTLCVKALSRFVPWSSHSANGWDWPGARLSIDTTWLCLQDFMIQGGDPTGTGRGGSSIYGYEYIPLPYDNNLISNFVPSLTPRLQTGFTWEWDTNKACPESD